MLILGLMSFVSQRFSPLLVMQLNLFLKQTQKTADILLDGIEFEIKSPKSANANSLEHILKKAVKQSCNIIIDTSRMKNVRDDNTRRFLINQVRIRRQINNLIMITKQGQIIDISALV